MNKVTRWCISLRLHCFRAYFELHFCLDFLGFTRFPVLRKTKMCFIFGTGGCVAYFTVVKVFEFRKSVVSLETRALHCHISEFLTPISHRPMWSTSHRTLFYYRWCWRSFVDIHFFNSTKYTTETRVFLQLLWYLGFQFEAFWRHDLDLRTLSFSKILCVQLLNFSKSTLKNSVTSHVSWIFAALKVLQKAIISFIYTSSIEIWKKALPPESICRAQLSFF